jgi:hypothetical protein
VKVGVARLEQVGDVLLEDGGEAGTDGGLYAGRNSSTCVVGLAAFLGRKKTEAASEGQVWVLLADVTDDGGGADAADGAVVGL